MSDNRKYYYMRFKESFFDSDEIILLESMPDGYIYVNILLKLYLKSLKYNGRLMLREYIPYNSQMIASITRHQVGTVEKALDIFKELGFIEVLDNGAIYMLDIELFIGQGSTEGERKKLQRMNIEKEKQLLISPPEENLRTNVKTNCGQMSDTYPPYIEIESEIESEIKSKTKKHKAQVMYFDDVEVDALFHEFLDMRKSMKIKNSDRAISLLMNRLNKHDSITQKKMLEESIINGWKGVFSPKVDNGKKSESLQDKLDRIKYL